MATRDDLAVGASTSVAAKQLTSSSERPPSARLLLYTSRQLPCRYSQRMVWAAQQWRLQMQKQLEVRAPHRFLMLPHAIEPEVARITAAPDSSAAAENMVSGGTDFGTVAVPSPTSCASEALASTDTIFCSAIIRGAAHRGCDMSRPPAVVDRSASIAAFIRSQGCRPSRRLLAPIHHQ